MDQKTFIWPGLHTKNIMTKDMNLICSVDSGPVPEFKWFLNRGLLSDAG